MTEQEKFDYLNQKRNVNRGYRGLIVWDDSVRLYSTINNILKDNKKISFKSADNIIDAAHSVCRNIAEGSGRRSKIEYLRFLDFAMGSLAEVHSGYCAFFIAGQITKGEFDKIEEIHYKTENLLVKLVFSLQKYLPKNWESTFLNIKYLNDKHKATND